MLGKSHVDLRTVRREAEDREETTGQNGQTGQDRYSLRVHHLLSVG